MRAVLQAVSSQSGSGGGQSIAAPLLIAALMVGAVVAGAAVIWIIRTRLLSDRSASDRGLFEQLRRMRDEGRLSEEEYRAVKGSAARRQRERMALGEDADASR